MKLKVTKLHPDAIIPTRGSAKASGLDLYALEEWIIPPGTTVKITTGIAFGIPEGYEIQVRPRSGMSFKTSLRVSNSPGTIDQDFTGSCDVLIDNIGNKHYVIAKGDRIAQAVLCPVVLPELEEVTTLDTTERGTQGFGSTKGF